MRGACIVGDQRERKCVFVCLCGWVHMCMCINICHIKMEVCVYVSVCMCVYLYMSHQNGSVCVYVSVCICVCVYICHIKMEVCVCLCECVHMCMCVCVYMLHMNGSACVCVFVPQAHFYPCCMDADSRVLALMRSRASRTEPPGRWWDNWPPVPPVLCMTETGILSLVRRVFCFCDKSFYQVLWKPKVFMFKA